VAALKALEVLVLLKVELVVAAKAVKAYTLRLRLARQTLAAAVVV
jgi:hypothetical protein